MLRYLLLVLLPVFVHAQVPALPPIQWQHTFGGKNMDQLNCLQQTKDGGYILGGFSASEISGTKTQASKGGGSDYWVMKLDKQGALEWERVYGGSGADVLWTLSQTTDGGYILGGQSNSSISGDKTQACQGEVDYWVVKIDDKGTKQWDATFGGSSDDHLLRLQQTKDGGYILGGHSHSAVSGNKTQASHGLYDCWLVKIDAKGTKQWERAVGGSSNDTFAAVQQTKDGGYLLGATSVSPVSGDKTQAGRGNGDYWVVKLDGQGKTEWDKVVGGAGVEDLSDVVLTKDNGYLLAGRSNSGLSGDKTQPQQPANGYDQPDFWLVMLDSNGTKLWDRTLGGNNADVPKRVVRTADGGYLVGGTSMAGVSGDKTQPNQGSTDYWLVKLDPNGKKLWDRTFGGPSNDNLMDVQPTKDGGYVLGGWSISESAGDKTQPSNGLFDYWVVKVGAK